MMTVQVKLAGPFRKYYRNGYSPAGEKNILPEGTTVADLLASYGIGACSIQLITVNRQKAEPATVLKNGDEIRVIPLALGG